MTSQTTTSRFLQANSQLLGNLEYIPTYLMKPVEVFKTYQRVNLRFDLIAGLTVAAVALPQSMSFALIAHLPPEMGVYSAIVGGVVGGLWGSSRQMHTGTTNVNSLLLLSTLLPLSTSGSPEFILLAGMVAVLVGVIQFLMGLARLGMLVNFVSHSVVVGFSAGTGVLIGVAQLPKLFGLSVPGQSMSDTVVGVMVNLPQTHYPTAIIGIGTIISVIVLKKINPKLPTALLAILIASLVVYITGWDQSGVATIGELPRGFPPLVKLPLFDIRKIIDLMPGVMAIAAIALVQTTAIARSLAAQTGQRLDSNQEFVGQGLANIAAGFFSGYPIAGSFSVSAVSFNNGARTQVRSLVTAGVLLMAMFILAPLTRYLPWPALSGVLILTAYGMVDKAEIARILHGTRGDAVIMLATFLGTMFLPLEFAVMMGILLSFALYIIKTSIPQIITVVPGKDFKHFVKVEPHHEVCPQLGIIQISGDLYFGAVSHVEETIRKYFQTHPEDRFLLVRMHSVNHCDFSGIHMLESVRAMCLDRGGDLFFVRAQEGVYQFMQSTGFCKTLGEDHFLDDDNAISYMFQKILDPAVCVYECPVRVFKECQNLPKKSYPLPADWSAGVAFGQVSYISPRDLWEALHSDGTAALPPQVIDVREPREFKVGHIVEAHLIPLPKLLTKLEIVSNDEYLVFVCRGGRRSTRAARLMQSKGYKKIKVLQGGMLAWEAAGLLEAID